MEIGNYYMSAEIGNALKQTRNYYINIFIVLYVLSQCYSIILILKRKIG